MPSFPTARGAASAPAGYPLDLPPLTRRQIRYRAERLGRVFGLGPCDVEDLAQDLSLEVLRALPRHDPSRSLLTTFAQRVMDLAYCQMARGLRRRSRRAARVVPLGDTNARPPRLRDRGARAADRADLRLDLALALAGADPDQRWLAARLRTRSVPEIARERGVHRGTVHRDLVRLRRHLRALDPAAGEAVRP